MSGIISAGGGGAGTLGDAIDVSEFEGVTTGSYLRGKSDGTLEERTTAQVRGDLGSGMVDGEILQAASGALVNRSLSAAGIAALAGATFTGALRYATAAGLTAGTTQTQGGGLALTADINEISTCATANDTVVLPTAAAGRCVVVINNGAETCQIFPASGDNLGQGANTSTTLASGSSATFIAYDATNWHALS